MAANKKIASKNFRILKKCLIEPSKFPREEAIGKACFSQGYKKYGYLETWKDAISILLELPENENIFNELILEKSLVKPYLDIEWYKTEFPDYEPNEVKKCIKELLITIFNEIFERNISKNDIFFAECHREVKDDFKFSFHVIISTKKPTIVFNGPNDASYLARELRRRIKQYFDETLVDLGVYSKTQNIRLIGHCKKGDFTPFEKCDKDTDDLDYIITNVGIKHSVLETPEQQDELYKSIYKKSTDISKLNEKMEEIIEIVKRVHPTSKFERIDDLGFIQFNYTDRNEPCFSKQGEDTILHEQIGFFAYIYNYMVCIGCHSSRCVDDGNRKITKIIGSIRGKKDIELEFQKVDFNNEFKDIEHDFIKECVNNGALGMSNIVERMYMFPKRIKWINSETKMGSTYFWDGCKWQQDDYSFMERLVATNVVRLLKSFAEVYENNKELQLTEDEEKNLYGLIKKLNNGTLLYNILNFSKPFLRDIEFADIKDIHPYFLSCKNGMVNLITGELKAPVPEDNITKHINTEYLIEADFYDFDNFIWEITATLEKNRDEERYNFLRWILGYCIQGQPSKKLFFIFYGKYGFNGKSLLVNIICDTLEYYAKTMDKSVVLDTGGKKTAGSHSTEICQLENSRLGILSDTKENSVIDDGQIKQLTSISDKLSVREIFGKQKEMTPTFVPIINTNHHIMINLSDKAMYERFIIFQFELSFVDEPKEIYDRKADNHLYEKFKKNKEGVLKWLIEASIYYNENKNAPIPEFVKVSKDVYNNEISPYLDFLGRYYNRDPKSVSATDMIKRVDILQLYKEYCRENSIKFIAKNAEKEFDRLMNKVNLKHRIHYTNIKLLETDDSDDDLT